MRAGRGGTRYPWGDDPERAPGELGLNFGIYDPVGDVWQWTADWWAPGTCRRLAAAAVVGEGGQREIRDPVGPPGGTRRVVRGGSWWCGACTCEGNGRFYRGKSAPNAAFNNLGVRCARDAAP